MQAEQIRTVAGPGIVVPGNDIDTDRIIPARYMKVVTFDGLGEFAFRDVRVDQNGASTDHPFNDPARQHASVLLVNKNFGCGSSREHAPQALMRWGIKGIVGESFAEIFAGNCNVLGIPAVCVGQTEIEALMSIVDGDPTAEVTVDLEKQIVRCGSYETGLEMPESYRQSLVSGSWDSTGMLKANAQAIEATAKRLPYTTAFA